MQKERSKKITIGFVMKCKGRQILNNVLLHGLRQHPSGSNVDR